MSDDPADYRFLFSEPCTMCGIRWHYLSIRDGLCVICRPRSYERFPLRLTLDQHAKLKEAAGSLGVSVHKFVSDAIDAALISQSQSDYRPT